MSANSFSIYLEFSFKNFSRDPDDITKALKVRPTKISRKGQANPVAKVNRWIINSDDSCSSQELEDHWHAIAERLIDVQRKIILLEDTGDIDIFIVVHSDERCMRSIEIPAELLSFSKSVNADISIEVYFM